MLRDPQEAQDVAQETFIRLWKSDVKLETPRATLAWAYRTSTHLAVDRLRGSKRRERLSSPPPASSAGPASVDAQQLLEWVAGRVPKDELAAAVLARADEMTQPEIAAVLDCSDRTVRRLLDRFDARIVELQKEMSHG